MIDHLGLSVSDLGVAEAFYKRALAPLGVTLLHVVPVELTGGERVLGFGREQPTFWLHQGGRQIPPMHIALTAENRQQVDAFYAAALDAGGVDNGNAGLRPHYHKNYYAAFVLDPDGNNIETVCHKPG